MADKLVYKIFDLYGKASGDELLYEGVIENHAQARADMIDKYVMYSDWCQGDVDTFIADTSQKELYVDFDLGDWDDPTGFRVELSTFEEEMARLNDEYRRGVDRLTSWFGAGEEK